MKNYNEITWEAVEKTHKRTEKIINRILFSFGAVVITTIFLTVALNITRF